MKKTALVTGATSGIGKATAELFAENGINLIICGRREERLLELKKQLEEKVDVHTLTFDVRDKESVFSQIASLPTSFQKVDILVNNAGNAHGLSPIHEGDVDDWDAMIDINVKGLLYVSKAIIEQMKNRKEGHIINIGSIAGKDVYPNGNVYNASKFAVNALNEAMRYDLNEFGIRVGAVHPGLVHTEFSEVRFKGDKEKAEGVYQGYDPLYAEDIADIIYFMVSRKRHVNIADLVVYPTAQASATIVNKK
ncbi:SDR family NAD(P)-dependent oxidoreductase [Flammeovirga sp. EKP202]|uniref:SDR family NAD(P)-dependent oxidoreductase n=1 Tax=Flammeovirga sp. EKP202 TaxID=2770592 RepID=UPI00165EDC79|nr:SDR family NAD(P)-dependent oxidoreductase [Flammeovirga sp. EKP202]MBD0402454.1 SDR family NAD(P)-dependent oxidoreductase [Flammeovirga sp. EKP202]